MFLGFINTKGRPMLGDYENLIFTTQKTTDWLIYLFFYVKLSAFWGIFV